MASQPRIGRGNGFIGCLKLTQLRWVPVLAIGIVACLLAVCLLLPLTPNVTFQSPEIAFSSDSTGTGYPEVSVTLQNNGLLPIWYLGNEWSVGDLTIEGNLNIGETYHYSSRDLSWNAIAPGASTTIHLPVYALFERSRINIRVRDWRGFEVECISDEFDFSSVPRDGVAGIGVQPPVPIPQSIYRSPQ
jgi:hypothetical protein